MIQTITMVCPSCGATLKTTSDREFLFCEYCGTKVMVDNNAVRLQFHIKKTDEAKIREIEAREAIEKKRIEANEAIELKRFELEQQEELEWKTRRARAIKIWLIVSGVATVLGLVLYAFEGKAVTIGAALFGLGFGSLFYGALIFWIGRVVHNKKKKKQKN